MPSTRLHRRRLLALGLSAALSPLAVHASDSPLRLIVPFSPGSTGDTVARSLATALQHSMGRPVFIDNLPGAGGMTGTAQMVRAPKDGNTLALVASTHVINPSIYKKMPFDSMKDITPIGLIGDSPGVLLVNPAVPASNVKELVALARSKPGQLNYGSSGNGTNLHLLAVLLCKEAGIKLEHVPYKGNGPMVTDLIGGQIQVGFQSTTAGAPMVKAGQLRAIGVSTKTRSRLLPDVPTLAEQGLSGFDLGSWMAIIGPAGLPAALVNQLNSQLNAALAAPEMVAWFQSQDFTLQPGSPEKARAFMEAELVKHTKLVKESGATLD